MTIISIVIAFFEVLDETWAARWFLHTISPVSCLHSRNPCHELKIVNHTQAWKICSTTAVRKLQTTIGRRNELTLFLVLVVSIERQWWCASRWLFRLLAFISVVVKSFFPLSKEMLMGITNTLAAVSGIVGAVTNHNVSDEVNERVPMIDIFHCLFYCICFDGNEKWWDRYGRQAEETEKHYIIRTRRKCPINWNGSSLRHCTCGSTTVKHFPAPYELIWLACWASSIDSFGEVSSQRPKVNDVEEVSIYLALTLIS